MRTTRSTKQSQKMVQARMGELLRAVTKLLAIVNDRSSQTSTARAPRPAPSPQTLLRRRKAIKAHWASMTKQEHEARVRKMLAARGLKPKPKSTKPPSAKSLALRKSIKAHWASMSKAEHDARVRKMLIGRGLVPKGE